MFGWDCEISSGHIFLKSVFFGAWFLEGFHGEFDPGSGRTLAACLTHASRTMKPACWWISGERVSNTWVICPKLWDKPGKLGLIPNMTDTRMGVGGKRYGVVLDGLTAYQLVGEVMAHQGDDP